MTAGRSLGGPTIRAALLFGFGLTFGLWLFSGYYFTRRVTAVQSEAARVNARYTHAQELLSTVRAHVLLGSVYVRDALLDPQPGVTHEYRRQIEATHRLIEGALAQYTFVLESPLGQERLRGLRLEIENYYAAMVEVLSSDSSRWATDARLLLSARLVPRREVVIRVSEEVQALNRSAFVQQQRDLAAIYERTQRRIWLQLGLVLAASCGIGLVATRYGSRLERRIREQMAAEAVAARDLQRLSSQIITAQEQERRAIARELHDEVGQVLTALKLELGLVERTLGGGAGSLLNPARALADGALQSTRDLTRLLHPVILDDLGLTAAVESSLKAFAQRHGLRATLETSNMNGRLPPETEAAAYRIVQEALTNVVKHAQAGNCRVGLTRLPRSVLVTIEDDGIGFDPAASGGEARGLGLIGIRERAAQVRGSVQVDSTPGRGTRVAVVLPAAELAESV